MTYRAPLAVPEDRLGRLEQEHRTLALELRLTVSVAEEAQQKQQQRIRSLEAPPAASNMGPESVGARLRKLERGETGPEADRGRNWWPEVSVRASDEAKEVSRVCDALDAKVCGLTASVEDLQKQLVSQQRAAEKAAEAEPASPSSPVKAVPAFEEKLEQLERFCLELRETLEECVQPRGRDVALRRQSDDGADRAEKLRELEVKICFDSRDGESKGVMASPIQPSASFAR
eukprot:Skav230426  [mRNA]  locus=scaffold1601:23607:31175:- [translate_table: standard]